MTSELETSAAVPQAVEQQAPRRFQLLSKLWEPVLAADEAVSPYVPMPFMVIFRVCCIATFSALFVIMAPIAAMRSAPRLVQHITNHIRAARLR